MIGQTLKTAPPTGGHVFQRTRTTFELNQHIIKTNILTNVFKHDPFHEDLTKNVTSRVFTRKTAPPTGVHTNMLTKVFTCFHYIHIEKNAPPTGGHVFSPIWTIFELVREINKTNVLTNFHDDWAKIVTSRVFTRKTALPTGGHIGLEIFELDRDLIRTKLLTKFHEDRTINVASRVLTNKCGRTDGQTTDKDRSQKLT
ncbi:hypothetical protein DPMN_178069 [Dreissena polymorpha]|uniref:Uncharacterized protein n=1 Tax=Dreissena polymorpha TaxID=45954 RepID=A0A9D4EC68_DREPO|nr:hypothetical protein DPMN_178069 [Dreissena polymorpha]